MSAAAPTHSPAAAAASHGRRPCAQPLTRRSTISSPATPTAAASTSRCPAAIRLQIISGLTVQSRCARSRLARSARNIRSAVSATAANAIAFHSFSQNTVLASDAPASFAAISCSAVASGP